MNTTNTLFRAVPITLVAALLVASFIAVAKWRNKPLSAVSEHALWTCVLAAMLLLPLPKITVHAGAPVIIPSVPNAAPLAMSSARRPHLAAMPIQATAPGTVAPSSVQPVPVWLIVWELGAAWMALRILVGIFLTHRSLASSRTIRGEIPGVERDVADVVESDNALVPMTVGWPDARIILPRAWRTWPDDEQLLRRDAARTGPRASPRYARSRFSPP